MGAATAAGGWLADRAGLPSGYLFAGMVVGLAHALVAPGRLSLPLSGFRVGQAVTGVAIGTFLQSSAIAGLGARWLPVALVSIATLAATIVAGLALARAAGLDRATASLGMVAGGASGMVAMADDLGADGWLVAFMQYLRVLVIALLTPILVALAFGHAPNGTGQEEAGLLGTAGDWAFTLGVAGVGLALGLRLRFPAPALLGPLVLTALLSIAGLTGGVEVPTLARECAFALIGLQVGLRFRRDVLGRLARLLKPVAVTIAVLLVVCFGFGWLLALTADVSLLDGYLAATPGGLYIVLPIAYGSDANTTFVLAVQSLRLAAMVIAAPFIVRWLVRRDWARRPAPGATPRTEDAAALEPVAELRE